jgi:ABC-type transport system involved in multi-copper enzyme maturation permease subunit
VSTLLQVDAAPVVNAPAASGGWLTHTARLVGWDLFQSWRRTMAKVLLALFFGPLLIFIAGLVILYIVMRNNQADTTTMDAVLGFMTFPRSVAIAQGYASFMAVMLLCILVGAVAGGEYGFSTQRLALSRGVGRGQAVAAKVLAAALLAIGATSAIFLVALIEGITIGPALGGRPEGLTVAGIAQLGTFWLATALRTFAYGLVALFFATLGRSTAAGIGGALGFMLVEGLGLPVSTGIIVYERTVALATHTVVPGFVGPLTALRAIFLQVNADALSGAAQQGPLTLRLVPASPVLDSVLPSSPPGSVALLVVLLWCAVLIGLTYLLVRQRDVTD